MIVCREIFIVFILFTIFNRKSVAEECNSDPETEMCSLEPPKQDLQPKEIVDHEKNKYSKGCYYNYYYYYYITFN